jgi:hypothetical protein
VDGFHPQSPARLCTAFTCFKNQVRIFILNTREKETRELLLANVNRIYFSSRKFLHTAILVIDCDFINLSTKERKTKQFIHGTCFKIHSAKFEIPTIGGKENNSKGKKKKVCQIPNDYSVSIRWCTCCLIEGNCQSLTRHRVATSRSVLRRLAEEPHRHRLVQSLLKRLGNYRQVP